MFRGIKNFFIGFFEIIVGIGWGVLYLPVVLLQGIFNVLSLPFLALYVIVLCFLWAFEEVKLISKRKKSLGHAL